MLKNIIGFTSQEREELNDKKDFLKKEKHSRMSAILVLMTNHFLGNFN